MKIITESAEDGGMGKVRFIFILTGHGRVSLCGQRAPPVGRIGHCSRFELYNLKRKSEKNKENGKRFDKRTILFIHLSGLILNKTTQKQKTSTKN